MVYVKRVPIFLGTKDPEKIHHKCHKNMTGIINSLDVITPRKYVDRTVVQKIVLFITLI